MDGTNNEMSLVVTVKNEVKEISALLDSILTQSDPPQEIIFVDGGSTDGTHEILLERLSGRENTVILQAPESNISQGRNTGIRHASGEIIAVTDAGCRLDRSWLEVFRKAFRESPSLNCAYGSVYPEASSAYEECAGVCSLWRFFGRSERSASPQGRSLVFRKDAFEKVGGFPEHLYAGEDVLFVEKIRQAGFKTMYLPEAKVFWRARANLRGIFNQFRIYARDGIRAKLTTRLYLGPISWLSFLALVLVLWLLTRLVIFPLLLATSLVGFLVAKHACYFRITFRWSKRYRGSFLWLIPVLLALHTGQAIGFIEGFFKRFLIRNPQDQ